MNKTLPLARCETCGMQLESFRYQRSNEDWRIQGGWVVERICQFCLPREYMNARNEVLASNSGNGTYGTHETYVTNSSPLCAVQNCGEPAEEGIYCCRCDEEREASRGIFGRSNSRDITHAFGIVSFCLVTAWLVHRFIGG